MNVSTDCLVVAAAIPGLMALTLAWPVRRHASRRALVALFVLGGFVSHVLTAGLNGLLIPIEAALVGAPGSIRTGLAEAFLTAALSEELARFLVALLVMIALSNSVGRDAELSCAMIGLGFAAYENAIFSFLVRGPGEVLVARTLATITHGAMAVIMGSLLRRAFAATRPRPGSLLLALLVPLLLHGLYDSGVFLLQSHEFPEPSDEPTGRELVALGAALAMMLPVLTVWLWQVIWAVCIVRSLRREARARIGSVEPVVGEESRSLEDADG